MSRIQAYPAECEDIVRYCHRLSIDGLVKFTSGNISARLAEDANIIAASPTNVPYDTMSAGDVSLVTVDRGEILEGMPATSELPLHLSIYRSRSDVGAVVHTHSPAVTVLAVLHETLPPVTTTQVGAIGGDVPIVSYVRSKTSGDEPEISAALRRRSALILPNHGAVCIGSSLQHAYAAAAALEMAAAAYLSAKLLGTPLELSSQEVRRIHTDTYQARWTNRQPWD